MKIKEEKFSKSFLKRNNAVGVTHGTSYYTKAQIVKTFSDTKKSYRKELFSNMNLFMNGRISEDQFNERQKQTIGNHFKSAFLLGKRFNQNSEFGLNDKERRMLVFQTTKEMEFMKKFAIDIKNKTGKMDYKRRMNMYASGLDPMFRFGDIAYLPENIQIQWKLGVTDKHCLDCLFFAAKSPYTKKTLPGIPKSGNSRCLCHCLCSLIYYNGGVNTKYTNFIIDNYTDARKTIPTEQQFESIDAKMNQYYKHRFRYEAGGVADYMENATLLKDEIKQFIKENDLAVSVNLYIADSIYEIKKFKSNARFELIDTTTPIKEGAFVSTFVGKTQVYGKVKSIAGTKVIIDTLFEKGVTLDTSIDVIFKDISDE